MRNTLFSGIGWPNNFLAMLVLAGVLPALDGGGGHEAGKAQGVLGELLGRVLAFCHISWLATSPFMSLLCVNMGNLRGSAWCCLARMNLSALAPLLHYTLTHPTQSIADSLQASLVGTA